VWVQVPQALCADRAASCAKVGVLVLCDGRVPNTAGLDLPAAGVEVEPSPLSVSDDLF